MSEPVLRVMALENFLFIWVENDLAFTLELDLHRETPSSVDYAAFYLLQWRRYLHNSQWVITTASHTAKLFALSALATVKRKENKKMTAAILQRRQLFITVISLSPNQKWVFWRRLLFEPHGCFDLSGTPAFCHVGQRGFAFWGFMCRLVCGLWPASSGLNKNRVFDDDLLCNHGKLEQRRISYTYAATLSDRHWQAG